jgi:hypothetical protein
LLSSSYSWASACGSTGQAARERSDSLGSAKTERLVNQTISASRRRGGWDEAGLAPLDGVNDFSRFCWIFEPRAPCNLESGLIQSLQAERSEVSARPEKQFHTLLNLQSPAP